MLTVVADTVGVHDLLFAPVTRGCTGTSTVTRARTGTASTTSPRRWRRLGIEWWQVPAPINIFQNTPPQSDGTLALKPSVSRPGDHIVFRALQNLIGALSSCPMDLNPVNGKRITPLELTVRRSKAMTKGSSGA